VIFHVPPALGTLGVLSPPDPSVLLILVLGASAMGSSADTFASRSSSYSGPSSLSSVLRREAM
jgi:hypothetical protein